MITYFALMTDQPKEVIKWTAVVDCLTATTAIICYTIYKIHV